MLMSNSQSVVLGSVVRLCWFQAASNARACIKKLDLALMSTLRRLKCFVAFYLWVYIRLNHISHTLLICLECGDKLDIEHCWSH